MVISAVLRNWQSGLKGGIWGSGGGFGDCGGKWDLGIYAKSWIWLSRLNGGFGHLGGDGGAADPDCVTEFVYLG